MNTDLSDEAYAEWTLRGRKAYPGEAWQECRRRAEALVEETEREAFEAAWKYVDGDVAKMITFEDAFRRWKESKWTF